MYDSRYEDIPEDNIATIKRDREFITSIIKLLQNEMVNVNYSSCAYSDIVRILTITVQHMNSLEHTTFKQTTVSRWMGELVSVIFIILLWAYIDRRQFNVLYYRKLH